MPGTTIISDKWRAYSGIESLSQNYNHLQVNHSENFKDPETGAHTNTIDGSTNHRKEPKRTEKGRKEPKRTEKGRKGPKRIG